jgi:hypothetical protein
MAYEDGYPISHVLVKQADRLAGEMVAGPVFRLVQSLPALRLSASATVIMLQLQQKAT